MTEKNSSGEESSSQLFDRSTNWIVERPFLTLLVIGVITGFALIGYFQPTLLTNLFKKEPETKQTVRSNQSFQPSVEAFSLDNDAVLVVQSDSIFTPEGTKALREIVAAVEETDYVRNVTWMDEVPMLNIFGLPEPLLPHKSASQVKFDKAKQKAIEHPFIVGQLLSEDANTVMLFVNFDFLFIKSDDDCITGLRKIGEKVAEDYPDLGMEFGVTGEVPFYVTAMQTHQANQFFYQTIGYCMIGLMAIILFRGVAAVLVVSIAPALGVFWTLGLIRFFEFQNNPFNDVVLPVLVSLVGLTDGVHLMVQIRKLRSAGYAPRNAARIGIRQVGLACALTSLTTAIGFGSLSLANHQFVQEFGYCCVIGVIVTFVSVVTTIPLVCSTWLGKFVQVGQDKSLIDKNLNRIGGLVSFVLPRTKLISTIAIVSTALFILVSLTLRPDERMSNNIPAGSEAALTMQKVDKALNGLEQGTVKIGWTDKVATDSPEIITVIGKVDAILKNEPLIGHPLSIRTLLNSLPGEGEPEDRMSMLALLPPPIKAAFYKPERSAAEVIFRCQDLGISAYDEVFTRVEAGVNQIRLEHPEFALRLAGDAIWRWENLFQIVVDLATSLGVASLIIFVVLAIVYRSIRVGLISIIPNMFPLAVAGAFLVVTGQSLEVVTVCAFTVCLGIAVDDTIHFLTRYQEERAKTDDEEEAIRNAFTGVGTALIITTIILVAGFVTVLMSDSRDHFIFASMAIITLSAALFADLIFLPAMLKQFARSGKKE